MKLEELLKKLEQIEQQAALTLAEYPHGLTVERQRLIIGLAKQMQSHLRDQQRHGRRDAAQSDMEAGHLRSVQNEEEAPKLRSVSNLPSAS
jgi:hypothetical protein